ncbi:MAG: mechanosensitive ion channel [Kiritimatiellae bacterium]|nr:mechanosensitive ion channel [Kiritimatiellia bacterium]NLD90156.1 mechanosensitive ion channel [Lentisphaerota bacterium]HPC19599.1 mechanosensitive ion channel [Kiritimatiellia bacterium]HQN80913.1 mechanosensitive ion channel [Kiritimatiellia bacterium]HQQ61879.1 mechanosensitive ion channel [Kiritimatiellia bacterium]
MDIILKYFNDVSWENVLETSLRVALILLLGWGVLAVVRQLLSRMEGRLKAKYAAEGEPPSESGKRVETLLKLVRQGARLAVWITVLLVILKELGVEIGPILAGAGILGLAVGFGAQNLVKDIITGFFFILENQIRIGDVAVINGTGGLVEEINFRTLVLRDVEGVRHIFPHGTVTTLSNRTRDWSGYVFDIGVAYKEDTDRVCEVLRGVFRELRQDSAFGPSILEEPEIFGVDRFADSAVVIKGRIKTKPSRQWMVGREFLRRTKLAFDREGIQIPVPHRTIVMQAGGGLASFVQNR